MASQDESSVNTTIQAASSRWEAERSPVENPLDRFTACVSGMNHETVRTQAGSADRGKKTPEKKNMGDTTRLK